MPALESGLSSFDSEYLLMLDEFVKHVKIGISYVCFDTPRNVFLITSRRFASGVLRPSRIPIQHPASPVHCVISDTH